MSEQVIDAGPVGVSRGDSRAAEREEATIASNEIAVPLIELREVCRTFVTDGGVEVRALKSIDLKIYPGEFVAIMGQSGSGKTTMMNILGCLDRPTSGKYLFGGRNIESFDADGLAWLRREAFGFVFQSYNLLTTETAEENVEVPGIYAGMSAAEREMRAEALLTSLGLGERLDHRPNQLSGGQQQRVSIARALMNGGNIILADEPTGALDSKSGIEVMALLDELSKKGHTVILITHEQDVAEHADRIIEFRDGRILNDSGHVEGAIDPAKNKQLRDLFMSRRGSSFIGGLGESVRMAMRSLVANLFRTVLTLLGIVIGVASVVTMLAIGEGAQADIVERISSVGTNILTLSPARVEGQRRNAPSNLSFDDADAIRDNVPNVLYALPSIDGGQTIRYGRNDTSVDVIAISETMPQARNWEIARGVYYSREDSENFTPVAVLGAIAYQELFPDGGDPLGEWVLIGKVPFQVIGVMTQKGGTGRDNPDEAVYVPLKTGALRLFGATKAQQIEVAVDDINRISDTENNVVGYLSDRHNGVKDFDVFNASEMLETLEESQRTFKLLLGSIGAISLLVGGIGVMNIMLVSVSERTREIGVRMATGARQRDILAQFLSEAVVVTALGGLIGILAGIGAGKLIQSFDIDVVFSSEPMILAFSCAAATGLIFGFAPAHKASKLDPVVALSNE